MVLSMLALIFERGAMHMYINQFHASWADFFFKYITHLGDGFVFLPLGIILWFLRGKYAFFSMLVGAIVTLLVVGLFKKGIFPDFDRPLKYIGEDAGLRLVEGVKMHLRHSFPSGHTTAAFAAWGVFALRIQKWEISIAIIAILAAWSRVYLSQHFVMDLALGSFLGLCIAISSDALISRLQARFAKE